MASSTHWSSRKAGSALGIDQMRVARVWAKAGLQPHRRRHYMVSDDSPNILSVKQHCCATDRRHGQICQRDRFVTPPMR